MLFFSTSRKNGFSLEEDMDAPPGQRYKLKAVPFSKNITFGVSGCLQCYAIVYIFIFLVCIYLFSLCRREGAYIYIG